MARVPFEAMRGQGQSIESTIDKERGLGSALTIGMKIASKFADRDYSYWHFDANAGCGHNDIVNVPGSPVVSHVMADTCLNGMHRQAFFCDLNRDALLELASRLKPEWRAKSHIIVGDNEDCLDVFAQSIRQSGERPEYAVGSILVDPNGWFYRNAKGEGAPISGLVKFAARHGRIDIILNLNARTYRLQRGHGHNVLGPEDVFANLNKRHWLVRWTHHGANDWLLAVGRNIETGDHRKLGFHKLESDEGRQIILKVEGGRQGDILDDAV